MSDNEQSQQREENANIDLEEKYSSKLMCTVVFLKDSDTSLWRSRTKLIF